MFEDALIFFGMCKNVLTSFCVELQLVMRDILLHNSIFIIFGIIHVLRTNR